MNALDKKELEKAGFLNVSKRAQRIIFLKRLRKELKVSRGLSYILGRNKADPVIILGLIIYWNIGTQSPMTPGLSLPRCTDAP